MPFFVIKKKPHSDGNRKIIEIVFFQKKKKNKKKEKYKRDQIALEQNDVNERDLGNINEDSFNSAIYETNKLFKTFHAKIGKIDFNDLKISDNISSIHEMLKILNEFLSNLKVLRDSEEAEFVTSSVDDYIASMKKIHDHFLSFTIFTIEVAPSSSNELDNQFYDTFLFLSKFFFYLFSLFKSADIGGKESLSSSEASDFSKGEDDKLIGSMELFCNCLDEIRESIGMTENDFCNHILKKAFPGKYEVITSENYGNFEESYGHPPDEFINILKSSDLSEENLNQENLEDLTSSEKSFGA